ncbi:unnamed protein product [Blepharisma stoltei]|uniref:RING-type domain-containing protein n=1 Tax=Blepharisma stoltei TaxID=1481888 RepID=A0AAU9JRW6_9CILI|nr:unnamed protein product [Blepharisma stoltei]
MGNTYRKLKSAIADLNKFTTSNEFYKFAGMRLEFHIQRGPPFRFLSHRPRSRLIQVYRLEDQRQKIGSILLENLAIVYDNLMYVKTMSTMRIQSRTPDRDTECSICLERYANTVLTCGHAFCDIDIIDWQERSQSCPICRKSLNVQEAYIDMEENPEEIVKGIENGLQVAFSYIVSS